MMTDTVGGVAGSGVDEETDTWDDPEEPGTAPAGTTVDDGVVPDDTWTVGAARDWLRTRVEHGAACPVCLQFSKVYRRKINAAMARALVLMWQEGAYGKRLYVHVPSIDPTRGGDVAKMEYWGLIEEERGTRVDGGRAGFWRLTARGDLWVQGKNTVPKWARVYDGKLLSLTGPAVSIHDALGERFRLDDLMAGV